MEFFKYLKKAFSLNFPVFLGYLSIGTAYGLLCIKNDIDIFFVVLSSFLSIAGAMQFILVSLLADHMSYLVIAFTTLSVNSRHIFYGLSFLNLFPKMGWFYPYMIFSLTDETYSVLHSIKEEEGYQKEKLVLFIAAMDHSFWVLGSFVGALIGLLLGGEVLANVKGLEFTMAALFAVIATEQWLKTDNRFPNLLGMGIGILFILILKLNILYAIGVVSLILVGHYFVKNKSDKEVAL